MQLRDPEIIPTERVLNEVLGNSVYSVLASFLGRITSPEYGLNIEWRYYNDGKAWLGKITQKKKTILWLSIWEGFFKMSFYFTEKHLKSFAELDISKTKKEELATAKPIGKLFPLTVDISCKEQLADLFTVVGFKKSLQIAPIQATTSRGSVRACIASNWL